MTTTTHTLEQGFCTVCGETAEWLAEHGATTVAAADMLAVGDEVVILGRKGHMAWTVESITASGVRVKTDRAARFLQAEQVTRIATRAEVAARKAENAARYAS